MAEDVDKLAQVEEPDLLQVLPLLISGGGTERRREKSLLTPISLRRPGHRTTLSERPVPGVLGSPSEEAGRRVHAAFDLHEGNPTHQEQSS